MNLAELPDDLRIIHQFLQEAESCLRLQVHVTSPNREPSRLVTSQLDDALPKPLR